MAPPRSSSPIARLTAALALALTLATCDEEKPFQCTKPADCLGRPGGGACKVVAGKGRCVVDCALVNGMHNCQPAYECTGMADDGSTYCVQKP